MRNQPADTRDPLPQGFVYRVEGLLSIAKAEAPRELCKCLIELSEKLSRILSSDCVKPLEIIRQRLLVDF